MFVTTGTVADNVRYGPQLRGKKLTDEEVRKLLILADLDASFLDKSGAQLSVGQAQRVALARTLANSPEVAIITLTNNYFTIELMHQTIYIYIYILSMPFLLF